MEELTLACGAVTVLEYRRDRVGLAYRGVRPDVEEVTAFDDDDD